MANPAKGKIKLIKNGTMLAIDPSSGSRGSHIGYALFDKGLLVESGEIDLSDEWGLPVHQRLGYIHDCLRESFPFVDLLVTEKIRVVSRRGSYKATEPLVYAIGVIMSGIKHGAFVEIHPRTHMATSNRLFDDYRKTDEYDAISIGLCMIAFANGYDPKRIDNKNQEDKRNELIQLIQESYNDD